MDSLVLTGTAYVYANLTFPLIKEGLSTVVHVSPVISSLVVNASNVYREIYESIQIEDSINISVLSTRSIAEVFSIRKPIVSRRMHRSSWQARLGAKLDPIKRKILDNQILLTAHPTDMLRINTKRDERSHDIISRTVVSAEVLPIVLPTLVDVPMRRLQHVDGTTVLSLSMSEHQDKNPFEAFCPMEGMLERDDLLFRILKDPHSDDPYFMVLQVKDELGTISYSSLLYVKYKLNFYDEPLPQVILDKLKEYALKREELAW